MNFPQGVAADNQGFVYVADSLNHIIRKISPASVLSTLAGLAGVPGSSDGNGVAARFSSPSELAVDGAGNVYVTDYDNCTIARSRPLEP